MVDCYPELTQEDCPEGTILKENLAFGGCCPACVTYMGLGENLFTLDVMHSFPLFVWLIGGMHYMTSALRGREGVGQFLTEGREVAWIWY